MRFKLRGEWGYTPFKLEESDKPYLTALKFTCPQQYEALMAVSEELTLTYEQIAAQLKCPVNTQNPPCPLKNQSVEKRKRTCT